MSQDLPPNFNEEFVSTNNSSTSNIGAGASFTGASDQIIDFESITINFKSDQPCTIQLQQSIDNTNWDFVNTFTIAANTGDSRTFDASAFYVRVIVTNNGGSPSTFFRLQSIFSPTFCTTPNALTQLGNFKTAILESVPIGVSGTTAISGTVYQGTVPWVTRDQADGVSGSSVPPLMILMGGGDVSGIARTFHTDVSGNLFVDLRDVSGVGLTSTPVNGRQALDIHQADTSFVISGLTPTGSAPTLNPVSVAGVDINGLKRHLLTDVSGAVLVDVRDGFGTSIGSQSIPGVSGNYLQVTLAASSTSGSAVPARGILVGGKDPSGNFEFFATDVFGNQRVGFLNNSATGTLAGAGQTVSITTIGCSTVQYSTLGTFTGTIITEVSYDGGVNWFEQATVDSDPDTNLLLTVWGDNAIGAFNNDPWIIPVAGTTNFRLRVTAYTSGSLAVQVVSTPAVSTSINPSNDRWAASSVSGINSTAIGATAGCSTCAIGITGTWAGTLAFQASIDHVNFFPVQAYNLNTNLNQSSTSSSGNFVVSCGGFHLVQAIFTSYTSGTALVTLEAGIGSNVNIVNRVTGNVNSGVADQGAPVKVGGVYNSTLPVVTTGQRVDLQLDSSGRLLTSTTIASLPAGEFISQSSINAGITLNTVFTATQRLALKQFYAGGTGIGKQSLFSYVSGTSQFVSGGDFENAGDVGTTWIWSSTAGTGSVAQSAVQAFTGTKSCALTFSNSAGTSAQGVKQTFSTPNDLSVWRYISAEFFNVLSSGGAYTRTISIILTDSNASTRTYSVAGSSTTAPFNASNWIQILGEIANPTSSTGTSFDITSVASMTLNMSDSGNKSGTVFWDTVKLTGALSTVFPIYHAANASFNISIDPVFILNIGDQVILSQLNNDTARKEYFALAGGVSI